MKEDLSRIPVKNLPSIDGVRGIWTDLKQESVKQNRTIFELSSVIAMGAIAELPERVRWLSASTRLATRKTGALAAGVLMEHYRTTLKQVHATGYVRYGSRQLRPYLYAAALQFSPDHESFTESLVSKERPGSQEPRT